MPTLISARPCSKYVKYFIARIKRSIRNNECLDYPTLVGRLCPVFSALNKTTFFTLKVPVELDRLNENNTIHYFNTVDYIPVPGRTRKIPVQTFVWKSPDADPYHMAGVAKDVLIKVLLAKHKIVGSDKTQSADGERFWRSLIDTALTEYGPTGIYIYLHDIRFNKYLQLPRITHLSELDELMVWGKTPEFNRARLLISLKPIKI